MSQKTGISEAPNGKVLPGFSNRALPTGKAARKTVSSRRPIKPSTLIDRTISKEIGDLASAQSTELFANSHSPPDSPSQRALAIKNNKLHRESASTSSARTNGVQPTILPSNHNLPGNNLRGQIIPPDAFYHLSNRPTRVSITDHPNGTLPQNALDKSVWQHSLPLKPPNSAQPAINGEHGIAHTNGVNGVNGINESAGANEKNTSHTLSHTTSGHNPTWLPTASPLASPVRPVSARASPPREATPDVSRDRRLQSSPVSRSRYSDSLKPWINEEWDRDDTDLGSFGTPVSRWNGQMSDSVTVTRTPQEVTNYVEQELSARASKPAESAEQPREVRRQPQQKAHLPHQPVELTPSSRPVVEAATHGPALVRKRLHDPTKPAVEQERLQRAEDFNQASLDAYIYDQDGASTPPKNVLIPPRPLMSSSSPDPATFLHINPVAHYNRPHSETWLKRKHKEIKARGNKKANFGKAAERAARQRRQQGPASLEEKMPDYVQANPDWMRAQQWFSDVESQIEEEYRQKASLMSQLDQAAQIQEQLEREAARGSS